MDKLAPLFNYNNDAYYIKCFDAQVLDGLDPQKVFEELQTMAGPDKTIVLICYEKPGDFYHRHLVAKWFTNNGIPCEEFVC